MTNIYWPRRPDLCNREGRDCRKLEDRAFVMRDGAGNEVVRLWVTGDYGMIVKGLDVEEVSP